MARCLRLRRRTALSNPEGLATNSSGDLYVADCGNYRVAGVDPRQPGRPRHPDRLLHRRIEILRPACANHPEWANLPCQTQPATQPETTGLPNLAVTTFTYNIWDEPESTTETIEGNTRTKTQPTTQQDGS